WACTLRQRLIDSEKRIDPDRDADRDNQGAAGFERGATGERSGLFEFGHRRLPQPIISAARLTARRMLMWVPQRHLRPVSASLISASLGFFLSRRNAAAVMIQPLMQ